MGLSGPYILNTITSASAYSSWKPLIPGCSTGCSRGGKEVKNINFICLHPKFQLLSFMCFLVLYHRKRNYMPDDTKIFLVNSRRVKYVSAYTREMFGISVFYSGYKRSIWKLLNGTCVPGHRKGKRVACQGCLVIGGALLSTPFWVRSIETAAVSVLSYLPSNLIFTQGWHGALVVSTVASQQGDPGFESRSFLCGVCKFLLCMGFLWVL